MTSKDLMQERPGYGRTREVLLRGLGAVYLSAFWSLAVAGQALLDRDCPDYLPSF